MRPEVSCVDNHRLGLGIRRRQPFHHAREHASLASALPPVVEHLVRIIGARRIAPAQPGAGDEHDVAGHPSDGDSRLAVATAAAPRSARPPAKTGRLCQSPRRA